MDGTRPLEQKPPAGSGTGVVWEMTRGEWPGAGR
jgi:hypothetical protein